MVSSRALFIIATCLQIFWGISPSASKIVIDEIPVELFITFRLTISALFLFLVLHLRKHRPILFKRQNLWAALSGVGGHAIASFGTLYGVKIGGVANFGLLSALSPVVSSFISILILREKPNTRFFVSLLFCVVGLLLLVMGKHELSSWNIAWLSFALILGAFILQSLTFVYSKKLQANYSSMQYLAIAQTGAALFMWLIEGNYFRQLPVIVNLSLSGWLALIYVSIGSCALAYFVHYWLLRKMDGHRLALFDSVHTLSATFFAILIFSEPLNSLMILGGAILIFSLLISNNKS